MFFKKTYKININFQSKVNFQHILEKEEIKLRFNLYVTSIIKHLSIKEEANDKELYEPYSHKWFGVLPFFWKWFSLSEKK